MLLLDNVDQTGFGVAQLIKTWEGAVKLAGYFWLYGRI